MVERRDTCQVASYGQRYRAIAQVAILFAALSAFSLGANPALADVRQGVDAWGRGDYAAAVAQWQGPASQGDPDAMFNMGQAYKLGRGVAKDPARAEDYYQRAAKKGHVRAADNYGILLFQTNRQAEAMPWLNAAADRGEPRAMYILGIAAYNGDYAPRDPVRAYALMTRAAATGLPQAKSSLAAMDEGIPLGQRQRGIALAQDLDRKASANRASEMSAADLASTPPAPAPAVMSKPILASASPTTMGAPGGATTAGADYAQPVTLPRHGAAQPVTATAAHLANPAPAKPAPNKVAPIKRDPVKRDPVKSAPMPAHETGGDWRVQLGAFGQKANADALWAKVHARPEIVGHARIDAGGGVTRLMAGGYSQAGAKAACAALKSAGVGCLVVNR